MNYFDEFINSGTLNRKNNTDLNISQQNFYVYSTKNVTERQGELGIELHKFQNQQCIRVQLWRRSVSG